MIRSILNVSDLIKARWSGLTLEAILFVVIVVVLLCGVLARIFHDSPSKTMGFTE
jgi:hypothetical protein